MHSGASRWRLPAPMARGAAWLARPTDPLPHHTRYLPPEARQSPTSASRESASCTAPARRAAQVWSAKRHNPAWAGAAATHPADQASAPANLALPCRRHIAKDAPPDSPNRPSIAQSPSFSILAFWPCRIAFRKSLTFYNTPAGGNLLLDFHSTNPASFLRRFALALCRSDSNAPTDTPIASAASL